MLNYSRIIIKFADYMTMSLEQIFPREKVRELKQLLEQSDNILVTCHMRPDGDAIGSSLGWYHMLRARGKNVSVIIPDRMPKSLEFLPSTSEVVVYTQHKQYADRLMGEADLILQCDFNAYYRQGLLAEEMEKSPAVKVLIDHHQKPSIDSQLVFSYPEMSSTCELIYRLMCDLGWYMDMPDTTAQCLLTGLITDTQNFTVNCGDPEIYTVLEGLLHKDVDKSQILWEATKLTSYSAMKLNAYAISEKLEVFEQHRCGLITLSADELKRFNYQKGETEGLVNEPLRIRGLVYSIFLREDDDCIKVSMRSRFDFPVSDMCEELGGGGHLQAAGAEFKGTLEECRNTIIDMMGRYDDRLLHKLDKLELK